jgi:hypothetical protein
MAVGDLSDGPRIPPPRESQTDRQTDRQTEPAYVCTKTRTDRQTYRQTELGAIARARARGGSDLENLRRV